MQNEFKKQQSKTKMAEKKEENASFVLRLSQKIYKTENGESQIQYRGSIRHVQTGDEKRFSNFDGATAFVQSKLSDLTMKAVEDHPEEEQKGLISKSFDFWKKMASATPKLVLDSIKDPKKQVAQFQDQLQEQFHQLGDAIGQKIDIDDILGSSKSDSRKILQLLSQLTEKVEALNEKVDVLAKKK